MSNIDDSPFMQNLVTTLQFRETRKQAIEYTCHEGEPGEMPLLSYMVNTSPNLTVVTYTNDGKETENTAQIGDIIMSGVFGEMYVLKGDKFFKLYDLTSDGKTVIPNQSPRTVAEIPSTASPTPSACWITSCKLQSPRTVAEIPSDCLNGDVYFTASWGEKMVLKNGDFLVRDGENFYRIAREEFLETYVWG